MLIVIGNANVIEFMINNVDSKKRNTGLEYKLKNIIWDIWGKYNYVGV